MTGEILLIPTLYLFALVFRAFCEDALILCEARPDDD